MQCFSCGLTDELVEAGGIYFCPNPFCEGCGATGWKVKNLGGLIDEGNAIELTEKSYEDWLKKGMDEINKMPYALGNKIMSLERTKAIIEELKGHVKNSHEDERTNEPV